MGGGYIGGGYGEGYGGVTDIERLENIARRELEKPARPPRRRVFISFRHVDEDKANMLRAQAKKENSKLDFIDMSLRRPFDTEDAEYIRRGIRARIERSSVTLVIVSETTYQSEWVNWEIRESLRQGKGVVVVNTTNDPSVRMPDAVNENRDKIRIVQWKHEDIMDAINEVAEQ